MSNPYHSPISPYDEESIPQPEADNYLPIQEHAQHPRALMLRSGLLGSATVAAASITAAGLALHDERFTLGQMSHSETLEGAVNSADNLLSTVGVLGAFGALAVVSAARLASDSSARYRAIDVASGKELTDDGAKGGLLAKLRGNVAAVPMAAAAMGTLFTGIGHEVEHGPGRPIASIASELPGGEESRFVVQADGVMPMVQSRLTDNLSKRIMIGAEVRGIEAVPYTQTLSTMRFRKADERQEALTIGMPTPDDSTLHWEPRDGCNDIPVSVDAISGASIGDRVEIQGAGGYVAEIKKEDQSAINRLTTSVDIAAAQKCIEKSDGVYGVALNTDTETANDIVTDSLAELVVPEPAVAIEYEALVKNSESFWRSNVKPLTNLITGIATGLAFLAISRETSMRVMRTRRELHALSMSAGSAFTKSVETLRSLKRSLVASALGSVSAAAATSAVSGVVWGTQTSVGLKEMFAGVGTVFAASAGSLAKNVWHDKSFRRAVDPDGAKIWESHDHRFGRRLLRKATWLTRKNHFAGAVDPDAIVSARDVSASYNGKPVLDGVNLNVKPGSRVLISGESGSGKSTLMNTLLGRQPQRGGTIYVNGQAISPNSHSLDLPEGVGYIPQKLALAGNLSFVDVAFMSARAAGIEPSSDELYEYMDAFGLRRDLATRPRVSGLSGGEQARLSVIAELLKPDQRIVFMDEPGSALDPSSRRTFAKQLKKVSERTGTSFVIITHDDMPELEAERYAVNNGRVFSIDKQGVIAS